MEKKNFEVIEDEKLLLRKGYSLMSYAGELSLKEKDRTRENTLDGGLSLKGANIFAEDIFKNLKGVIDVKIVHNKEQYEYDVYALKNNQLEGVGL